MRLAGDVTCLALRGARACPHQGNIGSAFPPFLFAEVAFFPVVIAVIALEDDDGVIGVRAGI
jgi:hypothetical protein